MSKNSNIIAVTMGDPSGVGTEISIRAKIKKIKTVSNTHIRAHETRHDNV